MGSLIGPTAWNLIQSLKRKVVSTVARAVIRAVNDATKAQELRISLLKGEVKDNVERIQNFGFSSNPPVGTEAIVVFVGGNRSHGLAIATEDRNSRLKDLATGESIQYNDQGDYVKIKADGEIQIHSSNKITMDANLEVAGDIIVTGNVSSTGLVVGLAEIQSKYNAHKHIENDSAPLPTDVPDNTL